MDDKRAVSSTDLNNLRRLKFGTRIAREHAKAKPAWCWDVSVLWRRNVTDFHFHRQVEQVVQSAASLQWIWTAGVHALWPLAGTQWRHGCSQQRRVSLDCIGLFQGHYVSNLHDCLRSQTVRLHSADALERRTICDRERGALEGDEISGFECAQRACDGFAARAQKFCDLLARQDFRISIPWG